MEAANILLDEISKLREEERETKERLSNLIERQTELIGKVYEMTYSKPNGYLKENGIICMTLEHATEKAKELIINDRRFGGGQYHKALTEFLPVLIEFAKTQKYTGNIPEKKVLNRFLNSKNLNYKDSDLIALILKYFGLNTIVVSDRLIDNLH